MLSVLPSLQADCIDQWIAGGAPPEKLILGIPTYARSFTTSGNAKPDIGIPISKAGARGPITREAGFIAYHEICTVLKKGAVTKRYPDQGNIIVAVAGNQWYGYDDEETIRTKVRERTVEN